MDTVGGGNPGPMSHVDRIDYANDTATALAKGPYGSCNEIYVSNR